MTRNTGQTRTNHLRRSALPAACLVSLALAGTVYAQGADADGDEAMRNIQSNFQRMTPPPRTVESINQELKHDKPATVSRGGGRGHGRRQQQNAPDGGGTGGNAANAGNAGNAGFGGEGVGGPGGGGQSAPATGSAPGY